MLKGYVHSLESFGSVDGPGVRYVIFLSGCAMRCQFCHNPDTWNMTDGKEYTTDQLLKTALRFKSYWGEKGGITVSGGEPLLQMDFLTELFRKAKEAGVHTTLDTSGNPYTTKEPWHSKWLELMKYTDLLLLDIKQINEQEHVKLTGQTNTNILAMARELSDMGKPVWIRHVLVPGGSDKDEFISPDDSSLCQVIWGHFNCYFISRQDTDKIHTKFSADRCQNLVTILKFYFEKSVWQFFYYYAFHFNNICF